MPSARFAAGTDAGRTVLDNGAGAGRYTESACSFRIAVRCRFTAVDVVAGDQDVRPGQACSLQACSCRCPGGGGDDCPISYEGSEESGCSRDGSATR